MINRVLITVALVSITGCQLDSTTPKSESTQNQITTTSYSANYENAKSIYTSKCAGCHGINGDKNALGYSDTIAGESANITIDKLQQYKAGELNRYGFGGLMKGQVEPLSSEDIKDLGYYIEKL